jgi:hypothetical protein
MRIACQEVLDQFRIGVDAAFRGWVHVAITPPNLIAAHGVGMTKKERVFMLAVKVALCGVSLEVRYKVGV